MDWHYIDADKEQVGPVPEKAMRALVGSGVVGSDTRVWRTGMSDWADAGKTELAHLFGAMENDGGAPAVPKLKSPEDDPLAFVFLDEDGKKIVDLVLKDMPLLIGSSEDCDIAVEDDSLSPRHAFIYRYKGGVFLEDQGSATGSFVNSVRAEKMASLNSGDRLKFGDWAVTVRFGAQSDKQEQAIPNTDDADAVNGGIQQHKMSKRVICGWVVFAVCVGFLGIVVIARSLSANTVNDADFRQRGQTKSSTAGSEEGSLLSVSAAERFLIGYGDVWCQASQATEDDTGTHYWGNVSINDYCRRNGVLDRLGPPYKITDFDILGVEEVGDQAQNGSARKQTFEFSMRVTVISTTGSTMGTRRVRGELTWGPEREWGGRGVIQFW